MTDTKLTNVTNPAAFGVEWRAGETGNAYQLVNSRDTMSLMFSVKRAGSNEWVSQHVVDPSRFGLTEPPTTFAKFHEIALAYING